MADENKKAEEKPMPWKEFLESRPPSDRFSRVGGAFELSSPKSKLRVPSLEQFCDSQYCGGVRIFDGTGEFWFAPDEPRFVFLSYTCRHCQVKDIVIALLVSLSGDRNCQAIKVGQYPLFGPHIPTKMFSLLGEDNEIFLKGRRAESQGMGLGAFAYYRRVVENQKNRLIDEIIKVSNRIGASADIISKLESARQETQFHKAIAMVKDGIPDVLKIDGHNPLLLLHTALSDGLHIQSDEECLIRATSIRVVMSELAERITQVLGDHAELKSAVSQLLQISNSSKQRPAKPNPPQPPT